MTDTTTDAYTVAIIEETVRDGRNRHSIYFRAEVSINGTLRAITRRQSTRSAAEDDSRDTIRGCTSTRAIQRARGEQL